MNAKKVGLAGAVVAFLASPAGAQTLTVEKARAIVTPFYEALNRPPGERCGQITRTSHFVGLDVMRRQRRLLSARKSHWGI